ncbi:MAG: 16S rRNA (guanine(966)-N(2))-methyltransferase RsmD [Tissierellia bacterium]|nr:16S rRNA (guanine(966)-N(2))-methyltransferase RsmD [Tissierellia bacterium]
MRIISGSRRGLQLKAPKGECTRPSEDRIKENMFNLLGPIQQNTRVLDCFAGSGALGLEAISRGATYGLFFEINGKAFRVLNENIKKANFESLCHVFCKDALKALEKYEDEGFDYVFIDPPYSKEHLYKKVLNQIASNNLLNQDGFLMIERSEDINFDCPDYFIPVKTRKYRGTVIEIWRKREL